jgi:hypothetical protein
MSEFSISVGGNLDVGGDVTGKDKTTTTNITEIPPECVEEWRKLTEKFTAEPNEKNSQSIAGYAVSYMADISKNIIAGALMQMPSLIGRYMK